MEIIPAIIPKSAEDLREKLDQVKGIAHVVQVDILDGKFVPDTSWPLRGSDHAEWDRLKNKNEGLPHWQEFYFEADLMIAEPEHYIHDFVFAGFSRLIVHIESTRDMGRIIADAHDLHAELGIAIDIDTPLDALAEYAERVGLIQCMGIAEIGRQGEPFDPRALEKISTLRHAYPDIIISVDGGVSEKSAPYLAHAGADRLVAGSAIWGSDDIAATIGRLAHAGEEA